MSRILFATVALCLVAACAPQQSARDQLHALFAEEWAFRLAENPMLATSAGHHDYNDRLPSMTKADLERRAEFWRYTLDRLQAIDREKLSREDRINFDIFASQLQAFLADYEFKAYTMPILADDGFHIGFARLPAQMPFLTATDYENYCARLRAAPDYFSQQIELMREGLAIGFTMPKVVLDGYEVTITSHIVDDPAQGLFYRPFANMPGAIAAGEQQRLRDDGIAAIRDGVVPAYRQFLAFMTTEYIPGCRTSIGASELPNGRAYYQARANHYTTLDLSVDAIHQRGLAEVQRIKAEMEAVIRSTGFAGDFAAFLHFLRTDPRFYATTPEQLLKEAAYIAKRMDAKLPSLIKTLPRLPYGVAPVPDHLAPKYTAGRYVGPAWGSTEPGYYWVNTYALDTRPLYTLEALTLHEAVPGHHLQIALSRELEDLPDFRRFSYISAFGEGWGLYSEWLGLEAGFYTDPYSNFGRLTYEMWRACRLVVDTGIHAMGWSRQQAMDYLASHTALSLHEVRTETDRYISWPGQALAYKIGELKIRDLRKQAEAALGERFDLREFHDVVLQNGAVPLTVLEEVVQTWLRGE